MRKTLWTSLVICTALLFGAQAWAQQPPAQPPAPPPPYGAPITLEQAKKVAAATEAEAKKNNWNIAVAIVGPSGHLVYFQFMDDTAYASAKIAEGKARSSAIFRNQSKSFQDRLAAGETFLHSLEGAVLIGGGVPIVVNGKLIGAIGVSGRSPAQDAQLAQAGADALK